MKTKKPETQARPWPEGFLLFYYWKCSNFLHKLWPIHKLPSKPGTHAFPETQGPQGDLSGPGSGQWSMGNVSFWTSICINLWLTPTNTILGVHSSPWVNMACINQHPINTESSLYRGTSEPWIEIVRRGTEHTGWENSTDAHRSSHVRHAGDRTEAAAVCLSHLSDLHARHVDGTESEQMDGAYTPQCHGYLCAQWSSSA